MAQQVPFDLTYEIEKCLRIIDRISNYTVDSFSADDVFKHTQMILRSDYAKYLRQSYSEPSNLLDVFKINQILLLVLNLFTKLREQKVLDDWFTQSKDYQWKFFVLQNIIMMGNEIQMNLELNLAFSSLAKIRQYFELYAIHYLIEKYGSHVFDHFLIHGMKNMRKFAEFLLHELKTARPFWPTWSPIFLTQASSQSLRMNAED
ncbi:hypothetical protein [Mycoplasma sp. ATU-Cv-508]|uniref:hypothetical protein n=1 Tax=Mycoplasma sp. ATU-Cv-508 TaxID=2048001 RepID=UPI000FDE76B5